jgi:glycosyltransferase involved in cell wall biosynthesis
MKKIPVLVTFFNRPAVLEKLLTDDELRTKIGKAGKLTIEREYSVKANTPNYIKIMNKVI